MTVGEKIGGYRILRALATGATGPLYVASREPAQGQAILKILPRCSLGDDALRRIVLREVATAAGLKHPNLVRNLGVEDHEGRVVLVFEHLDAEPLGNRMATGPGTEVQVLDLALQVLDALDAFHEYGLLHCDICPENILMEPDGKARLIGLGLGKNAGSFRHAGGASQQAFPCSAPEQLEGARCTGRSDLFCLGAVLYEWLTGERPFAGADEESYRRSLSAGSPAPPSQKTVGVSRKTDALLLKALETDPSRRFSSAAAMRDAVARVRRSVLPQKTEEADERERPVSREPGLARWTPLIVAAVALAVVVLVSWYLSRRQAPGIVPERGVVVTQITNWPGVETDPSISRDGRRVAFSSDFCGNRDLWVADLETGDVAQITSTVECECHPCWSPDGTSLAYCLDGASEGIRVIPAAGGEWRDVSPTGYRPDWSPLGNAIAFDARTRTERPRVWVITPQGEVVGQMTRAEEPASVHLRPRWSPDGQGIIYQRIRDQAHDIWFVSPETRIQRPVTRAPQRDFDGIWDPTGKWIYFCSGIGDSVHINRTIARGGRRFRMTREAGYYSELSISGDGRRIVFSTVERQIHLWRVRVGSGEAERVKTSLARTVSPGVSPDGRRIVASSDALRSWDVFIVEGGTATRMTAGSGNELHPRWAPDGGRLAFVSRYNFESSDIGVVWPGEAGTRLVVSGGENTDPCWSPDGRSLAFVKVHSPSRKDIWTVDVTSGLALPITQAGVNMTPVWSPDGSRILFYSKGESWSGLYVVAAGGGVIPRFVVDGQDGRWSPDGGAIAYSAGDPGHEDIWVFDLKNVTGTRLTNQAGGFRCPAWSPDGRRVAFVSDSYGSPDLWYVSATGGLPRRVAENTCLDGYPVWSPDGKWLYFAKEEEVGGDIWMYETF